MFRALVDGLSLGAVLLASATCAILVPPEECPSKDAICIDLMVRSTRPFSITFRGQSYSDSGGVGKDFSYRVDRVPLGQHEIAGATSADSISIWLITIGRISRGGVSPASLQSAEGPGAAVQRIAGACRVSYAPVAGTPLPYTLRIQFDVGLSTPLC
jgi:hypothetical protein